MANRHLDIFYICDENYAGVLAASITSLFVNNPVDRLQLTVYVLLADSTEETRESLIAIGEQYRQQVCIVDANAALREIETLDLAFYRGSAITNLRLYFDLLIPEYVHRILYLDADTLVQGDLSPLCNYDLHGKTIGMVLDAYGGILQSKALKEHDYYNGGVLLINCDLWRSNHCRQRVYDYIQEHGASDLAHPDQDLYNMILYNEIERLPIRYNLQTIHRTVGERMFHTFLPSENYYSREEIVAARRHPAIIHMIRLFGTNPWYSDGSLHPDYAIYEKYRKMTPWADDPAMTVHTDILICIERWLYGWMPRKLFFALQLLAIKMVYLLRLPY